MKLTTEMEICKVFQRGLRAITGFTFVLEFKNSKAITKELRNTKGQEIPV